MPLQLTNLTGLSVGGGAPKIYRYLHYRNEPSGGRSGGKRIEWSDDGGTTLYPNSIGTMTSDSAPSPLACSGNTGYSGHPMYYCYDGSDSTDFWSNTVGGGTLTLDLGAANLIALPNYIRFIGSPSYGGNTVDFLVSTDGVVGTATEVVSLSNSLGDDWTWTTSGGRVDT